MLSRISDSVSAIYRDTETRDRHGTHQGSVHRLREPLGLLRDFLLLFFRESGKCIIFGANKNGDCRLCK